MTRVVGRLHRVHFTLNPSKHTVQLAVQATDACRADLKGFADPEQAKAVIRSSQQEAIEALRLMLVSRLIDAYGADVDLSAFAFQVAIAEVREDDCFWSSFGSIYGSHFRVDQSN